MGHAVTIYESKKDAGGLNTYGIVPFRLALDVALWEAQQVIDMGVDMRTGVTVGKDVALDELLKNFDATIVACGMGNVPKLGIPGEDLQGVLDALDVIERAKIDGSVRELGSSIAVIGAETPPSMRSRARSGLGSNGSRCTTGAPRTR